MQNLAQLTQGGKVITTTGAFDNLTDHGIFGATSKAIGQSVTDQQKQMYRSIMVPLARIAAVTQSGGRYKVTESAVKQEMDAYMAQPGHTHLTMLEKMGELKQAFIRDAESAIAAGTLNPEQMKYVEKSMSDINKAVPWDVSDVIEFYQKGGKAKNFGAFMEEKHPKDEGSWKDM
jgi:flagellar motor component MotA